MKIKKFLLVITMAIFTVIGATSCGTQKVIITRPDYGGNIKVHTVYRRNLDTDEFDDLINEWLENNRDKTIVAIDYQCSMASSWGVFTAMIIYR